MQRLLSNDDLRRLEQLGKALRATPGTLLFDIGNNDADDVVLLEGDVELSSKDGAILHVRAGTDAARLRPRRYRGKAVADITRPDIIQRILEHVARQQAPPELSAISGLPTVH